MEIKFNNSELMAILTYIDDSLGYELEPLERATLMSIVKKINLNSTTVNRNVEEFAIGILQTYRNEFSKLTEEEYAIATLGQENPKPYKEYLEGAI